MPLWPETAQSPKSAQFVYNRLMKIENIETEVVDLKELNLPIKAQFPGFWRDSLKSPLRDSEGRFHVPLILSPFTLPSMT